MMSVSLFFSRVTAPFRGSKDLPHHGTHRRRPTHRFQVEALDRFETRVVPAVVISYPFQHGDQACATFTNTGDEAAKVAIASYSFSGQPYVSQQTYFASDTGVVPPHQSITLCVDLDCTKSNQVDAFQVDAFQVDAFKTDAQFPIITKFDGTYPGYGALGYNYTADFFTPDCDCDCNNQKQKGNEGLGNGLDDPAPGLVGYPQNDLPAQPGDPQFKGGGGKSGK